MYDYLAGLLTTNLYDRYFPTLEAAKAYADDMAVKYAGEAAYAATREEWGNWRIVYRQTARLAVLGVVGDTVRVAYAMSAQQ